MKTAEEWADDCNYSKEQDYTTWLAEVEHRRAIQSDARAEGRAEGLKTNCVTRASARCTAKLTVCICGTEQR